MNDTELEPWMSFKSVQNWNAPQMWSEYFEQAGLILKAPLTHLDDRDPVRKKPASIPSAADYVCAFNGTENGRMVFGIYKSREIHFSIDHFHELSDQRNSMTWHFPATFGESLEGCNTIRELFDLTIRILNPFYAFVDETKQVTAKSKRYGTLNLQCELLGVFWLTYFNSAYVEHFGSAKFEVSPSVEYDSKGGAVLVLSPRPSMVDEEVRSAIVNKLGSRSFVHVNDPHHKPPGRYALTFKDLLEYERRKFE